jgi:hypothetical protein
MRPSTGTSLFGVALLLAGIGSQASPAQASAPPGSARSATAGSAAQAPDGRGLQLLYGTVVTEDGERYTGVLRWGNEEAFWDDLFQGTKGDLPYIDRQPEKDRPRHEIRFLGFLPIGFWEEGGKDRQFVARFGDIKEVQPLGEESAEITMRNGTKYQLAGGSNDVGTVVHVDDADSGGIELNWKRIERIILKTAPAPAPEPTASRLFGEVATEGGTFRGFIQWDSQECLSTDRLDGDSEDGRVSLEMGRIRAIEKRGSDNGVRVETSDGRELDLRGTNDVNDSIRGILVEDERYGRVRVSWEAFRRVDFRESAAAAAGRRYADYQPSRSLKGTVTDRSGKRWQGKIVFDLDESETWEMLDGARRGIEYSVPFEQVSALEPLNDKTTRVTLRNGQKLELGKTQDVSENNAGVLVLQSGAAPEHYLTWASVARIDLD